MKATAPTGTKVFGMSIGVDPKLIVGGLLVLAAILFWFNSRSSDDIPGPSASSRTTTAGNTAPAAAVATRTRTTRRARGPAIERGVLRIRAVDATHGDIDPTLRLDLLSRLQVIDAPAGGRSLFEIGPAAETAGTQPIKGPTIIPAAVPQPMPSSNAPIAPVVPVANIPLKFYGFAKPEQKGKANEGLFLDNDNVIVASEGQMVEQRYLVVELTPNSARLEDTQMKLGQTLPVVPEAAPQ